MGKIVIRISVNRYSGIIVCTGGGVRPLIDVIPSPVIANGTEWSEAISSKSAAAFVFPPPVVPLIRGRKTARMILPDEKLNLGVGEKSKHQTTGKLGNEHNFTNNFRSPLYIKVIKKKDLCK